MNIYRNPPKLLRFAIVGGSGTVVSLATIYFFTDVTHIHYLISNILAFIFSVSWNFIFNSLWTFGKEKSGLIGYGKYVMTSMVTMGIGEALLYLFTSVFGIWYLISSVVTIPITFIFNYTLSKRLVWNQAK